MKNKYKKLCLFTAVLCTIITVMIVWQVFEQAYDPTIYLMSIGFTIASVLAWTHYIVFGNDTIEKNKD